jgi:hypothetical protein
MWTLLTKPAHRIVRQVISLKNKMTNIIHLGKYYFPDTGGIESVTSSLAKGATQAGHKVTVVCFKKSSENNIERIEGVRVLRAPISRLIASQPLSGDASCYVWASLEMQA